MDQIQDLEIDPIMDVPEGMFGGSIHQCQEWDEAEEFAKFKRTKGVLHDDNEVNLRRPLSFDFHSEVLLLYHV